MAKVIVEVDGDAVKVSADTGDGFKPVAVIDPNAVKTGADLGTGVKPPASTGTGTKG